MYKITPKQASVEIMECVSVGLTPYLQSSPGMGKSSVAAQVAKMGKLKLIDIRLAQCTPEDLQGFPMRSGNKATFTPFDIFPIEGDSIPEGYDGWMILLDELSSAPKPTQAAAYKLILDRMVGSFNLHQNVCIVAAGNLSTDKAVVNQMSTALQSRLIHYEMEVSHNDWMEWAVEAEIDPRVMGFLHFSPNKLMDFKPDHADKTFPCPRTWEFLSRLVKGKDVSQKVGARIAGTVGNGAAIEFITFAKEFERLPKYRDIVNDPDSVDVPRESSTKYAVIMMLMANFKTADLKSILKYVKRFDMDIQVIFSRGAVIRQKNAREESKEFSNYLLDMVDYLS